MSALSQIDNEDRGMRAKRLRSETSWSDVLFEFMKFSIFEFNQEEKLPHFLKLLELCKKDLENKWYYCNVDFDWTSDKYGHHLPKLKFKKYPEDTINMLHLAIMKGLSSCVPFLIEEINPNIPTKNGESVWYLTFKRGMSLDHRYSIVKDLAKVADVNLVIGKDGIPVLYYALHNDLPIDVIRCLINAGANPNYRTETGRNSLFYIETENLEIIEMLLKAGADPNWCAKDDKGYYFPAIFIKQAYPITHLFLNYGADGLTEGFQGDSFIGLMMKKRDNDHTDELVKKIFHDLAVQRGWLKETVKTPI